MEPGGSLPCSQQPANFEVVTFRNQLILYGERLLDPRPTPKLVHRSVVECVNIITMRPQDCQFILEILKRFVF
jgi:hypothetical protein